MLVFYNLFFKPFVKTKKKFRLYFILIFSLTFSLIFIFQLNTKNKLNMQQLNSSMESRKIEITNLSKELDISDLKKINHVTKCYEIYEETTFTYDFAKLETIQSIQFDYEDFLTTGKAVNDDNYEIVLPNFIVINDKKLDLSIYYNKTIDMNYIINEETKYQFQAKVVGIYDNYDDSTYVIASEAIFSRMERAYLKVQKYYAIVDDISNINIVLEELNKVSNSHVLEYSDYEESEKAILINNILNFVIIFIIIILLAVFSLLTNNLIYDLRNDISILRAYGYSSNFILKNILLIVLIIYILSFFISNVILFIIKLLFSKYIELELLNLTQQIIILAIGIITIIISSIISIKKYSKQSISTFLKS